MSLSLSKKRQKELDQLRAQAELLLQNQQTVLDHATAVAREAGRQAGYLTREEIAPRVRENYQNYVAPTARKAAHAASDTLNNRVIPAVGTVLGTALSVADIAKDARVQAAVKRLSKAAPAAVAPKKKGGFGTFVAVSIGVAALAGVAYAVWQTFRADDELWVADEPAAPEA